jgi:hypothetical protein
MLATFKSMIIDKKKAYAITGALAGLLTLGLATPVGASGYGGYGGYGGSENDFAAKSGENYSESHEASTTVAATASYRSSASCDYSSQYRYDAYSGKWEHMAYNADSGEWYSCEHSEAYDTSYFFNQYQKDNVNYNNYNDFMAHDHSY